MYISHLRSEGDRLLEAVDELIAIARRAKISAEIYHLKAAGRANWGKLDEVLRRIEAARASGLRITADIYPYTAGATGLDAAMPTWVQAGGIDAWIARLKDPATRARVVREIAGPGGDWENLYRAAGSAENVLLVAFTNDRLKPLTGKTLAEVAKARGTTPEETIVDLVIEDGSRVGTIYFLMDEENLRKELRRPWVSVCSDEGSLAPEGVFLKSNPHPRAYGAFARVLGRYVREQKVIPLEEAVRRLTSLPAENLKLGRRGRLKEGYFADVVVFDPARIADRATYDRPHRYATGVETVLVNGTLVLDRGEHTGAKPGRAARAGLEGALRAAAGPAQSAGCICARVSGARAAASASTRCVRPPSTTRSEMEQRCTRCGSSPGTPISGPPRSTSCGKRRIRKWRHGASTFASRDARASKPVLWSNQNPNPLFYFVPLSGFTRDEQRTR